MLEIAEDGVIDISIHAPREGGDNRSCPAARKREDFNPRPPRGGRPTFPSSALFAKSHFNPRPPRGGRRGR